jgi:CO/xanthine dehydrogenase Mo-binding subunit
LLSEVEYNGVGKRPVRHNDVDKGTGGAQYGADLQLTGLLHAQVLRRPHAHARIKSTDINQAEAPQGVISHAIGVRMQKLP